MATIDMKEQMKLLVELQGVDIHILKSERAIAALPEELKAIDDEFHGKAASLKSLEDGLKALQLKRKEKEGELATKEESIKKFQSQLYQVKTNKEYTALEGEIARVRADNSIIEEEVIGILDQIDLQNQKIAKEKEGLKGEEAKAVAQKKAKEGEVGTARSELENLKAQRAALAAKVDPMILKKYERIMVNRDGLAVVPVINEACQGCFRVMPPQVINEVRMHQDLILCDNCARILYAEE